MQGWRAIESFQSLGRAFKEGTLSLSRARESILTHTHTHTHTLSLSLSLSLSLFLSFFLSLFLSLSLSLSVSLSLSLFLSLSLSLSPSQNLTSSSFVAFFVLSRAHSVVSVLTRAWRSCIVESTGAGGLELGAFSEEEFCPPESGLAASSQSSTHCIDMVLFRTGARVGLESL